MNNPKQIKELLTPPIVAQHYLGKPCKTIGNRLWYKSPFRNERTASFMVDNKSFHDFGSGWDGDVINFIEAYYNTNFINAMKILSRDFALPDNEKINKELENYLKQKREEQIQMQRNLDNWFNDTYGKLCNKLHLWQKIIPHVKGEALVIAYKQEFYLDYLTDLFMKASENEKIELWKDRKEIEKCF